MAELLLPLQTVLVVEAGEDEAANPPLQALRQYAEGLQEQEREAELLSPAGRLLAACRDIIVDPFIATKDLLQRLLRRVEEDWDWSKFHNGEPINKERLAALLAEYDIHPKMNKKRTSRGYYRADFEAAWGELGLGAPPVPPKPVQPVQSVQGRRRR